MSTPQGISETAVRAWYMYVNEVIGTLALTSAFTALQFKEHSAEVATFLLFYIMLLHFSMAAKRRIRFHQDRLSRIKGSLSTTIEALLGTLFLLIGVIALTFVALGFDLTYVKGWSLEMLVFRGNIT
ncbi:hypothetical protein [Pseudoalteromonas rubra]|uniref:Uncharacterized protein n=1 Tax=Pseudoalteromonas rubra TaxID=43658 RepID=A0A0F4Q7R1_9GAMM|nr:hypothetical protein [Pseudoalteromonas rubra]KJZ03673.1 hypothetical protein TW77_23830 [Pseudoalteromonas rubra]